MIWMFHRAHKIYPVFSNYLFTFKLQYPWENTMYKWRKEYPQKDCDFFKWEKSLVLLSEFLWHGICRYEVVVYCSASVSDLEIKKNKVFVKKNKTIFM